tara:strand:- start:469 stop:951 length:483 start_codon:yes stop_codon:yes gene_type:complete
MSKQTFSIWLLPIDSDHNYLSKIIQSLSEEHDAPFFQPHCTLFSSFSDLYSAKKIIDQLDLDFFDVEVRRISQSSDIWKTVFIELKNSSQLQNLNCLLKGLKDEDYLFSPHISLIYKLLDVNKRKKITQSLSIKKSFSFGKISIVNTAGHVESWETVYST